VDLTLETPSRTARQARVTERKCAPSLRLRRANAEGVEEDIPGARQTQMAKSLLERHLLPCETLPTTR